MTLAITNLAENRRRQADAAERQKERATESLARDQARREALEDAWRADKVSAHRELMFLARQIWHSMVDAGRVIERLQRIHTSDGQGLTPEIQEHLRQINEAFKPLDEATKQMDAILTTVQMFCSEESG